MRRAWLAYLPLLFLPDFGLGTRTRFGELEPSDYLVGPYILLLLTTRRPSKALVAQSLRGPLVIFVVWAVLSSATITFRYGYTTDYFLTFSLLKLGKLGLYLVAGVLTLHALAEERARSLFPWSLLVASSFVSVSLLDATVNAEPMMPFGHQLVDPYKTNNAISVMLALMLAYMLGLVTVGQSTRRWRKVALGTVPLILAGFLVSEGRGGWVALVMGLAYLFYQRGLRKLVISVLMVLTLSVTIGYYQFPKFRTQVEHTLDPDRNRRRPIDAPFGGYDGGRFENWTHEAAHILEAPLLGTGFFHRGGASGIWVSGSHNFWLQMFVETGLVGGFAILILFFRAWRHTASPRDGPGIHLPVRSTLVAAFVGGMSGEYFYGGLVVFTIIIVYAQVGAQAAARSASKMTAPQQKGVGI